MGKNLYENKKEVLYIMPYIMTGRAGPSLYPVNPTPKSSADGSTVTTHTFEN